MTQLPVWVKNMQRTGKGEWKTLMKSYRRIVDHNNRSENDMQTCQFFNDLDEPFGMRPNVTPVPTSSFGVTPFVSFLFFE